MNEPSVTVLMAVYNDEQYLREAIDSILAQTFHDFEFLVVNDGSTDGSLSVLKSYRDPRLRIINQPANTGLSHSLNTGLALARGEFIARHDADDVSHATRLDKQVDFMTKHPEVAILGTRVRRIKGRGHGMFVAQWGVHCVASAAIRFQFLFDNPLAHSSVMFRRSVVWSEFGGYSERSRALDTPPNQPAAAGRYQDCEDFELWSRLHASSRVIRNLPDRLVTIRHRSGSLTSRSCEERAEKAREILEANIMRTLGPGNHDRWLDLWIKLNNPPFGEIRNVDAFLEEIETLRSRFVARHPEAAGDPEIDYFLGDLLVRVSCLIARQERRAATAGYLAALHLAPVLALRHFPRFTANLLLRRAGLQPHGKDHESQ